MKCPVCKQKMIETSNSYDREGEPIYDGHTCETGHYTFSDSQGKNGGFYVRVGKREMHDLYAHSVKKCRLQNKVLEIWFKRERKRFIVRSLVPSGYSIN